MANTSINPPARALSISSDVATVIGPRLYRPLLASTWLYGGAGPDEIEAVTEYRSRTTPEQRLAAGYW
jgi:hypothetical protein